MGAYRVVRSTTVHAVPATVRELVDDFHAWPAWSPWEGVDPALERTYSGAEAGVGARYAWRGNRRAGAGSMEIVASTPHEIGIDLTFLKPFRSQSRISFGLTPDTSGESTTVTWTMTGEQTGLAGLLGKVVSMDTVVGKDFEKGLARLRAAAERTPAP